MWRDKVVLQNLLNRIIPRWFFKLEEFDSNYQDALGSDDFKGLMSMQIQMMRRLVALKNILVDEAGRFRYLVVDTGFWVLVSKYCYQ